MIHCTCKKVKCICKTDKEKGRKEPLQLYAQLFAQGIDPVGKRRL